MKVRLFIIVLFVPFLTLGQHLVWERTIEPSQFAGVYTKVYAVNDSLFQALGKTGTFLFHISRYNENGDTVLYLDLDSIESTKRPKDHTTDLNGNIVLAGGKSNGRTWIASVDTTGQINWEHVLDPTGGLSDFKRIKQLNDGGFLAVGDRLTDNNLRFSDVFACRLDSLGNIQWVKHFPINHNQIMHDFVEMPDGSFFLSGYSEVFANGVWNQWPYIFQVDIWGNMINEYYPVSNGFSAMNDSFSRIALLKNRNVILTGHDANSPSQRYSFITELDTSASVVWDTLIYRTSGPSTFPLNNGGFMNYCFTLDSGTNLLEFNSMRQNSRSFFFPNSESKFFSSISHCNTMILGVGVNEKDSFPNFDDFYAARYDSVGEAFVPDYCAWNVPEAGFYYDYQWPLLTLYDSSFSGLKYHDSIYHYEWFTSNGDTSFADTLNTLFDTTGGNTLDVTLIITNWHGCKDTITRTLDFKVNGSAQFLNENTIRIYPNPAESVLRFEIRDRRVESYSIHILDLHGRELLRKESHSSSLEMDISTLASGIYVVEISTKSGDIRKKLVKQ